MDKALTTGRTCSAERREKVKASRNATALRRKHQIGFVYECKVVEKRLNKRQKEELKRLFVEGKWFYNHVLNLHKEGTGFGDIDAVAIKEVTRKTKDKEDISEKLTTLTGQERQAIVSRMSANEKTIERLTEMGKQEGGELHFMSEMTCIPLKQYGVTYKFTSKNKVRIGGISGRILLRTGGQLDHVDEFACANLIHRADGYFLKVTCFVNEENYKPPQSNGKEIGLDLGIKDTLTTSEGEKIDVLVEESERLKKLQKEMFRRRKGSNNRWRTILKIRREYQRLTHRKQELSNKIVCKLKKYDRIVMQDELLSGWHRGLFGKQVQHSCLGLIKAKVMRLPQTVVLASGIPTTKFCPHCKTINQYITMADRVYKCGCGYEADRDTHAARNMIFIKDMVFANSNKLPTEHRKVTLTEFRASIGDVTVSDKPERRSEKIASSLGWHRVHIREIANRVEAAERREQYEICHVISRLLSDSRLLKDSDERNGKPYKLFGEPLTAVYGRFACQLYRTANIPRKFWLAYLEKTHSDPKGIDKHLRRCFRDIRCSRK